VKGVQDAPDESEVVAHEVPEDDVPEELVPQALSFAVHLAALSL
jgi:hypothetical protein